jgi:hypothetical protein
MPFSFKPNQEDIKSNGITPPPTMSQPTASTSTGGEVRVAGEKKGIFQILLYVIAGGMILVTLVLVGYQYFLNSQIQSKKDALALYETKLGGMPLEEMRKTSDRIKAINQILQEHASVSTAFRVLEDSIEHPLTYTRFGLSLNPTNKTYDLEVGVIAPDYKSVAQQLDTFNKSDTYKEFISLVTYSGISLDALTGKVTTAFKMPIHIEGKVPETIIFKGDAPQTASVETQAATSTQSSVSATP